MNLNELRAERADTFSAAEKLINTAKQSGKDLVGAELTQYNASIARMKELDTLIARCEQVGASTSARNSGGFVPVAGGPVASVRHTDSGAGLSLKHLLAQANMEQREQVEGLVNYLSGRSFRAGADLTPGGDGGYVIPSFIVPALERNYAAFAPVASVARLWGTDTGADTVFPVLSDSENAVQLDPAAATGADDVVTGDAPPTSLTGPTLKAWKVSSKPVFVNRELFTDGSVDIISEVIGALLARIIRFENLKYTKGNGTTEAEGFLTNATAYTIAHGSTLDLDVALDLAYSVAALYRPQGVYQMTDTTAKYLRKLKTGLSGDKRQLWADADATKGTPATLHGYPVVINNDMDDVAADGTFAAKNPLAFGDYKRFVVRQAENNQPFAYRYSVPAKDGSAVILFRRSDSKLLVPTAISKLAVAAS